MTDTTTADLLNYAREHAAKSWQMFARDKGLTDTRPDWQESVTPDGSLLRADPAALTGTPFSDWRVPGVLLAGLVGGGFLLTGWWQWRGRRHARELSMAAGLGLACFEAAELGWLGFQPLEAVFAVVGVTVTWLAWRLPELPL